MFLPLYYHHREYFYDWCAIGSIYGAPADCIWGGGRTSFGVQEPEDVLALMCEYGISARLTFSNSLLREEHLADKKCKEIRTYDLLDRLGIEYDRIDHAPAMTMEVCQEIDKTLQAVICKNLFLCNRQETAFYLLMIPDTKVFHTKDLSAQIHSARLSFAKPEYMEKFLDITPGSVSVLGLMNDTENQVQLLIDEDVLNSEYVGCHPCINTSSLRLRTKDLVETILPAIHHEFIRVKL